MSTATASVVFKETEKDPFISFLGVTTWIAIQAQDQMYTTGAECCDIFRVYHPEATVWRAKNASPVLVTSEPDAFNDEKCVTSMGIRMYYCSKFVRQMIERSTKYRKHLEKCMDAKRKKQHKRLALLLKDSPSLLDIPIDESVYREIKWRLSITTA